MWTLTAHHHCRDADPFLVSMSVHGSLSIDVTSPLHSLTGKGPGDRPASMGVIA